MKLLLLLLKLSLLWINFQFCKRSIEKLKDEPEKQGKALSEELLGYRSIRSVGQRYRIIYRIEQDRVVVVIVGVGRRKEGDKRDVYAVTQDLISDLEIDLEDDEY